MDDAAIGKNITRLRGDMSQAALAEEMKAKGWKWSQSTVWSVEKGDRPLRLREALDLADALGTEVHMLTVSPRGIEALSELRETIDEFRMARKTLALTTKAFRMTQGMMGLARLMAERADTSRQSDDRAWRDLKSLMDEARELGSVEAEQVVRDALRDLQQEDD